MPQEVTDCPLCHSAQRTLFDRRKIDDRAEVHKMVAITNYLCTTCGLVYMSPRMTHDELATFYEHEYRLIVQGSQGPNKKDILVQALRAEHLVSFTSDLIYTQHNQTILHHLDIGSSTGLLMQKFQDALQCTTVGIEPGQAYREYARESGLVVFASVEQLLDSFGITGSQKDPFDLVSMIHVLEHIPNPVDYLVRLRKELLAEDGWLLLEVPNLYAHDCFEIAHTISFSPHSLEQTLLKAGFHLISLKAHGEPRSQVIPLYLTALASPARNHPKWTCTPESAVRQKRYFGLMKRRFLSRFFPRTAWKALPL